MGVDAALALRGGNIQGAHTVTATGPFRQYRRGGAIHVAYMVAATGPIRPPGGDAVAAVGEFTCVTLDGRRCGASGGIGVIQGAYTLDSPYPFRPRNESRAYRAKKKKMRE